MKRVELSSLLIGLILLSPACATTPEQIVQEQVQAYNARDLESFVGLYSHDAAIHKLLSGELVGQGEAYFRQRYTERFTSSPDLHATIHDRLVLGDFVVDHEEVVRRRSEPTVSALAIYHVDESEIDHVWFVFDEDVRQDAAEEAQAAMGQLAKAVRRRDSTAFESVVAPDAQIVSLPDGRVVSGNRAEIMALVRPFVEADPASTWNIEKQITFGNVVASLETLKAGDAQQVMRRIAIYEFSHGRMARCWIVSQRPVESAPIVATHYFYWYRWPDQHFNQPGAPGREGHFHHLPDPEQVSYASPDWHARQFAAMHRAGIDVALPVYWGAPGAYDREGTRFSRDGLKPMIEALRSLDPPRVQLGLFYDTSTLKNGVRGTDPPEGLADLTKPVGQDLFCQTIIEYFEQIPVDLWARVEGRPLVVVYSAAFAAAWGPDLSAMVRDRFQRRFPQEQLFIVADASWGDIGQDRTTSWGAALHGPRLFPGVAQVGPGYNDTPVPGRTTPIRDREEGNFYRYSWRAAVRHRPQLVLIETWNEMHEGTEICETLETGTAYLEITAEWVAKLKNASDLGPEINLRWQQPIPRDK